jgi:hypothetical protein
MNLKTRSFTTQQGIYAGVTWTLLTYRPLPSDVVIRELDAIYPQMVYTHKQTKERVFVEPEDHAKAVEKAVKLNSPLVHSDWDVKNRWNLVHQLFWQVEPSTIEIEFPPFDEQTPTEVQVFADYWRHRDHETEERWKVFSSIIGTETANAWAEAYAETRDHVMEAPAELQTPADPADSPEKKIAEPEPSVSTEPS